MSAAIDITGQRFGRLTALAPTKRRVDKKIVWKFSCDCGNIHFTTAKAVRSGNTKSCGCIRYSGRPTNSVTKACLNCGSAFTVKKSHDEVTTYCSKKCMAEGYSTRMKGKGNPNYRGGISAREDYSRTYAKKWRKNNPEAVVARNRATRQKRRGSPGRTSTADIEAIRLRQDGLCAMCRCSLANGEHLDHMIPIDKGGTSHVGNMQMLCSQCNLRKKTMTPIEYRVRILCGETEDAHQAALLQWASVSANRMPELCLLHHVPNGGYRTKREAAKFAALGVRKGVPDLSLPVARGGFHGLYIELKVGKNKPTPEQQAWLASLSEQGFRAEWCRGWERAREVILDYLGSSIETIANA